MSHPIAAPAGGASTLLAALRGTCLLAVLWMGGAALAQPADTLRPAVATPLQSVQALLAAGKPQEAMATLRDVERKILDRSVYESYVLERLKAAASLALGDELGATAATEAALVLNKATPDERRVLLAQLTGFASKANQHEATLKWSALYLESGGTEPAVRAARVRAALARSDCPVALEQLALLIEASERQGGKPAEGQLKAAAACQAQLKQEAAYQKALEQLLTHYPRKDYWADRIARLQRQSGFADRLLLDTFRLMHHVGALDDPDDIMSAAQLALLASLPGEARRYLKGGMEAGHLGKGPAAAAQRDLLARATKEAEADQAQLDEAIRQAQAAPAGLRLFRVAQAAASYGQAERALPLMDQALAKGIDRNPQDARLHRALALVAAGQKAQARAALGDLPNQDGLADLGRLWLIALRD